MTQRDPFSWADDYQRLQMSRAAAESNDAQNALMSMFNEEAARQRPYSDLPVDLAKQNNLYKNMYSNAIGKEQFKADNNFKVPKDALNFGANIADRLAGDLGISREAAAGIVGNLASETGNFQYMQEIEPVVPGSRGGAGWAMWTGPRRKDFERFTGGDTSSPEANYAYLVHDLKNNYPQVLEQLRQTNNPLQAAKIIHDQFLIPGVPHLRKSAMSTQKIYETMNMNAGKRVVGDAEYDRRRARTQSTADNNNAFGSDIKLSFDNVGS